MKKQIFWVLIYLLMNILESCNSLIECDNITHRQATLLVDVSDKKLFDEIENDLTKNFPVFMQKTGLGNISPCESFTLSMVQISSDEELEVASASISISRKGQSKRKEKEESSPLLLVRLLKQKIIDYKQLVINPEVTTGTNICNVLLKSIIQTSPEAQNYFIVFSDMVENNDQLNLYRKIPDKTMIPQVLKNVIEPIVMNEFQERQRFGVQDKVIIVMKEEPNGKTNKRIVKDFWIEVFKELKLEVLFIDNLTNNLTL